MKTAILFLAISFPFFASAQQDSTYYYQFGEKVFIQPVPDKYIVEFKDTL